MVEGDDREGSDVDILVTSEDKPAFQGSMGRRLDLEERLGRRVDLLAPKCLRPELATEIEKEAIRVP